MDKYWLAIKKQNSEELVGILRDLPELVHSSLNCNPWRVEPDDTYTYETKGVHVCSLSGREQLLEILLRHKPNLDAITFEENKGADNTSCSICLGGIFGVMSDVA